MEEELGKEEQDETYGFSGEIVQVIEKKSYN